MKEKLCPKCKLNLRAISKAGKTRSYCKVCEKTFSSSWGTKNTISRLLSYAKSRAKKYGLEVTVTVEDLILPEYCPIIGIKLNPYPRGKAMNDSPSLHRIDSSKGYTKENTMICSWRANDLLSNASIEELEQLLNWMKLK